MSAKEQILKCIVNRMSAVNPLNIYKIILKSLFTYHLLRSLSKVIVKMKYFLDKSFVYHFFNASCSNYHLANELFKFHLHNWFQF